MHTFPNELKPLSGHDIGFESFTDRLRGGMKKFFFVEFWFCFDFYFFWMFSIMWDGCS